VVIPSTAEPIDLRIPGSVRERRIADGTVSPSSCAPRCEEIRVAETVQ